MTRQMETDTSNGQRSVPELMRSIASDTAMLVRKEVELARREMLEALVARLKAAGAMAAAGGTVMIGLIFLALAAAHALDGVMASWAARLIVGGGFFLIAAMAAAFGLLRVKNPPLVPEKTVETVKEDVEWAKAQLNR
jgi:hypothetical protein